MRIHGQRERAIRIVAASCSLVALIAGSAPAFAGRAAADPPGWLRDRVARGPLSGAVAVDDRWTSWSLASGVPLSLLLPSRARFGPDTASGAAQRIGVALSLAGVFGRNREQPSGLRTTAVLDRGDRVHGTWLGLSSGARGGPFEPRAPLRLATGMWRTFAPVQAEVSVVSSVVRLMDPTRWYETTQQPVPLLPDTVPARDTTLYRAVPHVTVWTSGQGALRWRLGRVELETVSGVTIGDAVPMRVWAQGTARVQLSRRLLLTAAAGRRPESSLSFDTSAQPRSMIGLELAPWASSSWALAGSVHARAVRWQAGMLPDGRVVVHVRCRDTRRVELAADFTDWRTVELAPIGGGWWECLARAEAGIHQVRLRLDHGAWEVPPGLPRAIESLDAPAGVMVLP